MALIPKPIRQIWYIIIGCLLTMLCAVLLSKWLGNWGIFLAFLLYPLLNLVGGMPIDYFDRWLRRKTRDPIWLMTYEGREWLKSEEGQVWQQNQGDRKPDS
jgi:hypothetical protein